MLKAIQCNKFMEQGQVRPPIIFKRGLNTILGDEAAANSIGKSTLLMIIDFVYGGDDYIRRSIDIQEHVGPHTINFTFEFAGDLYYFSRATNEPTKISICNEQYQPQKVISKDEYTAFLLEKFQLDLPGLTLRNAIGRFFRVYGRETLEEKYPLRSATRETEKAGIEGFLKLFDRYREVAIQTKVAEAAKEEEKTFRDARKYNYLPATRNKVEYQANEERMLKLKDSLKHLMRESSAGFVDLDSFQTEELADLRQQLSLAKRRLTQLTNELEGMETDHHFQKQVFEKNYAALQQFFPGLHVRKLEEIENFHKQTAAILKKESQAKCERLQILIDLATQQIAQLETQISELGSTPNVNHAILDKFAKMQAELHSLQIANNNYNKKEQLKEQTKASTHLLNLIVLEVIDQAQAEVNAMMSELNNFIYQGERTAPRLTIENASHYRFWTPNDCGTGSQYKGLIIFDLAALKMTNLPLLVHDSVLLKQIEDQALEAILELYEATDKQIFIVLDKKTSFTHKAQEILNNTAILQLYPNGGELFGRAWNHVNQD